MHSIIHKLAIQTVKAHIALRKIERGALIQWLQFGSGRVERLTAHRRLANVKAEMRRLEYELERLMAEDAE